MAAPRLLLILALAAGAAQAHDTWFRVESGAPQPTLALGTGQRYPVQDSPIGAEYLERQGCRAAPRAGGEQNMRPLGNDERSLQLRLPPGASTCWAQLVPLDIELPPAKVAVYLREIRAADTVRAAWRAQQAQGLPWIERYTKHARVDLAGPGAAAVPMDMDIVRQRDGSLRVLRDGQPLAGQPVELVNERLPLGFWRRSDEQGLLDPGALPSGTWLARATELRPVPDQPGHWESRFVTLAFEVSPTRP
jgi:hypothetical protein